VVLRALVELAAVPESALVPGLRLQGLIEQAQQLVIALPGLLSAYPGIQGLVIGLFGVALHGGQRLALGAGKIALLEQHLGALKGCHGLHHLCHLLLLLGAAAAALEELIVLAAARRIDEQLMSFADARENFGRKLAQLGELRRQAIG